MYYGWRVVGSAFIAQLFVVGFFTYAVSLLVEPIRSEFGVSLEQVMYSLTAATFVGLFMQPIGGILIDRYSVRTLMAIGALLYALGLYAAANSASPSAQMASAHRALPRRVMPRLVVADRWNMV